MPNGNDSLEAKGDFFLHYFIEEVRKKNRLMGFMVNMGIGHWASLIYGPILSIWNNKYVEKKKHTHTLKSFAIFYAGELIPKDSDKCDETCRKNVNCVRRLGGMCDFAI